MTTSDFDDKSAEKFERLGAMYGTGRPVVFLTANQMGKSWVIAAAAEALRKAEQKRLDELNKGNPAEILRDYVIMSGREPDDVVFDEWSDFVSSPIGQEALAAFDRMKLQMVDATDAFVKLTTQLKTLELNSVKLSKPMKKKPYFREHEKRSRW